MKKLLYFSLFLFSFSIASGQSWLWGGQATGQASEGYGVSNNSKGDAFITGVFFNTLIFGKDTLTILLGNPQIYLAKYNNSGTIQWALQSHGIFTLVEVHAFAVIADKFGNSYLTGFFMDSLNLGSIHLAATVPEEFFLAKIDSSGKTLWITTGKSPHGNTIGYAMTMEKDSEGDIYTTGDFQGTIEFGPDTLTSTYNSMFLVKFSAVTGYPIWARQPKNIGTSTTSIGYGVTVDKNANVFITGSFVDTVKFGSNTLYSANTSTFLVKYDSSGKELWAKQPSVNRTLKYNSGSSVATDKFGNPCITGNYKDTLYFDTNKFYSKVNDIYIAKYDTAGALMWANSAVLYDTAPAYAYAIGADTIGSFYIAGAKNPYSGSTTIQFGNVILSLAKQTDPAIVVQFDYSGKAICGSITPTGGDENNYLAVSPSGKYIYFGGDFLDTVAFGPDLLISSNEVPFVASWQPCSITVSQKEIQPSNNLISVFPNPSNGVFTIEMKSEKLNVKNIEIYNVMGQKVQTSSLPSPIGEGASFTYSLNLSAQPNGVYFYRVLDENGGLIGEGKIIVQR